MYWDLIGSNNFIFIPLFECITVYMYQSIFSILWFCILFSSITISPSLCDRYFPRHFVPLPVQAGGRCSHGPVSPSDVCGHRLHRFLQGLEPGPLLGKAARRATSLSEAVRPLSIISALPSLANRLLPPASSYRRGRPLIYIYIYSLGSINNTVSNKSPAIVQFH